MGFALAHEDSKSIKNKFDHSSLCEHNHDIKHNFY